MRGKGKDTLQMAEKRKVFVEKAYSLFSEKNIESVSLQNIADASGYGIATLYRYFTNKPALVIEVAAWKWEQVTDGFLKRRDATEATHRMNSREALELFLDSFIGLYRNHRDVLRFNQFFNIYIQAVDVDPKAMEPYQGVTSRLGEQFHRIYDKALGDGKVRTDIPDGEMFSTTLHLMLAAVTRYAVGLAYKPPGFDAEKELEVLKNALLAQYTV